MKNPYLTTEACVDRLYREWQKHPKLIVAFDQDSTVFPFHDYEKDFDYSDTINLARKCQELGFYIVVFTGTAKEKWPAIWTYWEDVVKVKISSINCNPITLPFGNDGKIYFNILLDDRSGLRESVEILNKVIDKIEKKAFYSEANKE